MPNEPKTAALAKPEPKICEVCSDQTDEEYLDLCVRCERLFAPCCNSQDARFCVECAP